MATGRSLRTRRTTSDASAGFNGRLWVLCAPLEVAGLRCYQLMHVLGVYASSLWHVTSSLTTLSSAPSKSTAVTPHADPYCEYGTKVDIMVH